ncbi:hypothetical protein BC829DRAFT_208372 [Chytridium lagenaria]|nr:hypothetical protein BC829DRAFT_208372 [Chytridium lagenaria]
MMGEDQWRPTETLHMRYPDMRDYEGSDASLDIWGKLNITSTVQDFRSYHQEIPHPASVLNLVADEQDRDIYTVFDELCNELLCALGDFEASLEEMTIWKDDFLTQTVPSNVKLQLTLLFSRLFRSKSEMHEPMFELIKQVRLYSRPWTGKQYAILELEKDYNRQNHILDISIRKLENLQFQLNKFKSERRIILWDRLARKMLDFGETNIEAPESRGKSQCADDGALNLSVARQIQTARSHVQSRNESALHPAENRAPSQAGGRSDADSELP